MKKIAVLCLFAIPAFAIANTAPKVLAEHVTNTSYVESITGGVITMGQAWEGQKIVKLDTGECRKIEHSNLRIVDLGHGLQGLNVDAKGSRITCPA